jgi:hypothetical protein
MAYRSFNPANVELHPYAHWSGKERKPISLPPASARRSDYQRDEAQESARGRPAAATKC